MSEEERGVLEAMRAREAELEGVLAAQEGALRSHQRQVWEHQAARARMQAEWDALQGRVRPCHHAATSAATFGKLQGPVLYRQNAIWLCEGGACRPRGDALHKQLRPCHGFTSI